VSATPDRTIEIDGKLYRVGDRLPHERKLVVRPARCIDNRPSFRPCRGKGK